MGFADSAKAKKLADALTRSKEAPRRTSSASTENSQLTSSPPTVYRLGPMNIPKDLAGMTKLLHSELQKIEQSQSVILSIAQKMDAMKAASVETVYGQAPDENGDVSPQNVTLNTLTAAASVTAGIVDATQLNNNTHVGSDIWVDATPGGGNVVLKATNELLLQANGGTVTADNSQYVSNHDVGFIQNAPWNDVSGNGTNYDNIGFPIWMNGSSDYASYHIRGQVQGQYDWAQWVMSYPAGQQVLEMQSSGAILHNGGAMATLQKTESVINMSIALAREELKAEIYAELLALNPGIVIPRQ